MMLFCQLNIYVLQQQYVGQKISGNFAAPDKIVVFMRIVWGLMKCLVSSKAFSNFAYTMYIQFYRTKKYINVICIQLIDLVGISIETPSKTW